MMHEVENMFPEVKEYTLDTPIWNVRTNEMDRKAREERALFFELMT